VNGERLCRDVARRCVADRHCFAVK
jgi:hypothetical protein